MSCDNNVMLGCQDERIVCMWNPKYREELNRRRAAAVAGGGEKRVENQHRKGKLTARERVNYLFDEGSFVEINTLIESQDSDLVWIRKKCPVMVLLLDMVQSMVGLYMHLYRTLPLSEVLWVSTIVKKFVILWIWH